MRLPRGVITFYARRQLHGRDHGSSLAVEVCYAMSYAIGLALAEPLSDNRRAIEQFSAVSSGYILSDERFPSKGSIYLSLSRKTSM
jgi:hypothetical protein